MAFRFSSLIQRSFGGRAVLLGAILAALATNAPVRAQDPILDAYSREIVVVNSEAPAALTQAYSREAVVLANETPPALTEAFSRYAVVISSELPPLLSQAYSRESILIASEVPPALTQAYSKEAVLVVSESPIVDIFSREIAVYDGYYVSEAFDAMRIAGGIQKATPANMDRFALALQLTSATRINLPVAVRILRIATRLQP